MITVYLKPLPTGLVALRRSKTCVNPCFVGTLPHAKRWAQENGVRLYHVKRKVIVPC